MSAQESVLMDETTQQRLDFRNQASREGSVPIRRNPIRRNANPNPNP